MTELAQAQYKPPDLPSKWDVIPIHNSDRGSFKRCRRFPNYAVSEDGRVFSFHKWNDGEFRELKQETITYGYKRVTLYHGNTKTKMLVHRLVAEEFLGKSELPEVKHLDDNPSNNHVSNLAWSTKSDNMNDRMMRNGHSILSELQEREIRELYSAGGETHRSLAEKFKVTKERIGQALNG